MKSHKYEPVLPAAEAVPVDTLIEARWIVPVEPMGAVLEHHALAIRKDCIVDLLPAAEARCRYVADEHVVLPHHLLIPGLINLHTHAAMTLLRGYADDVPLADWLGKHIWPAEARHVGHDFVRDGSLLACAEMLRGGVTCFNDMYFFPEATAEAALRLGMRAALGILTIGFPSAYASDADDYLNKGLATRDALREQSLISFCMAPHAPYTVSDSSLEKVATLAAQLDIPVHIHVHETRQEIKDSLRDHGVRPLARLHRLGLVGPNFIAVHAVYLSHEEITLLADFGGKVAHCPVSNLKLASGIAPVAELVRAGVCVGLGSDGAASNNRLDLFREMNFAALLAKGSCGDASVLQVHEVLRMATLNAACALGMEQKIGSLLPGKQADICAIRLDDPLMQPCYDPLAHLVHVAGRECVSHVWVAGRPCLSEGKLLGVAPAELMEIGALWQNRVLGF